MDDVSFIIHTLVRLSLILALGWVTLKLIRNRNPRWSVLLSRCLISAALIMPLACLCLPVTSLAVLPPIESESDVSAETSIEIETPMLSEMIEPEPAVPLHSALPQISDTQPERNIPVANLASEPLITEVPPIASPASVQSTATATLVQQDAETVSESIPQVSPSVHSEFHWWLFCWIAVSSFLLLRIAWQIQRARKLLHFAETAPASLQSECDALAQQVALKRVPPVRLSQQIEGPCTVGLFLPTVLLPDSWVNDLSPSERRAILMHELSHVAGFDSLWDLLSRIVLSFYWFHPLVWRLPAQHRLACEHMSDALAADSIDGFETYRRLLAGWALHRQGAETRAAALAMADRSFLLRRLKWLETARTFKTLKRSRCFAFVLFAVLLSVSFASIRLSPQVIAQKPEPEAKQAAPLIAEKPQAEKPDTPAAPKINRPNVADINLKQTTPKTVRVVDEKDQPIEGAKVSVFSWEDNDGDSLYLLVSDPPETNGIGEVTIQVPAGAVRAHISAVAPGYAKAGTQYSLSGSPTLQLKPGRILHVKAVDTKGGILPDAYPLLEDSHIHGREFKQDKDRNGYFTSPVVKPERRWMRVVDGSREGPVLFSDLIDVSNPEKVEQDGTIVATLRPGIRLEGRLDDSVPRPVKYGCVELYIKEGEDHQIGDGWTWQDTAIVKEDGTFEFDSLPTGGHVQLFALVDGYQSIRPSAELLKNYLITHQAGDVSLMDSPIERQDSFWPHLFPLTQGLYKVDVVLPCTPTTSLDVSVVDPLGQPIDGAKVKFSPNGYFIGGELFIPTIEVWSMASVIRHKDTDQLRQLREWSTATFLGVRSDAKGVARVRNLPADGRDSYRVSADGYEMPLHPTSDLAEGMRYAVVEMAGGKTLRRTITMEKLLPGSLREIQVVDQKAKPIADIKVTVSEIAFRDAPEDWQLWASQRFGPLATGKTGIDGIVRLQIPLEVNGQPVSNLRIMVQGRVGKKGVVRKRLTIPRISDGRIVVLTPSDQPPKTEYHFREVKADYLQPKEVLNDSPKKLLAQLQAKPSLVVLNRLLELADFDDVTLLGFHPKSNLLDFTRRKESERGPVVSLPTKKGTRVVVLCTVRPRDAGWDTKPPLSSPPKAAFVFDASDGSLIRMIGGWASAKGVYCDVMLTNQGGTDDNFVSTFASEDHGPFNKLQQWFHLGEEQQPAITTHNYHNSTGWYGKDGPSTPLAELGYIQFNLNTIKNTDRIAGTLPNGTEAPRKIYWDGARDLFIGPIKESVDGKPLYQVVLEESFHFKPLIVQPGELVAGGGRRDYQNWHWWECVVPAGKSAELRLFSIDETGEKPVETEYRKQLLPAGEHMLQLQLTDSKQDDQLSDVEIRIDQQKEKLTVPRVPIAGVPSVKGVPIARTAKESLDLFNRPTAQPQQRLIWRVTLK